MLQITIYITLIYIHMPRLFILGIRPRRSLSPPSRRERSISLAMRSPSFPHSLSGAGYLRTQEEEGCQAEEDWPICSCTVCDDCIGSSPNFGTTPRHHPHLRGIIWLGHQPPEKSVWCMLLLERVYLARRQAMHRSVWIIFSFIWFAVLLCFVFVYICSFSKKHNRSVL